MSEQEIEAAEAEEQEVETLEEEGQEEAEAEAPKEPERDPEAEAEARKYGWRPKEEFTRDPEGWVDAKRFLELPSTEVKRLRDELKQRDQGFDDRLKRLDEANKAAMKRALDQQKAQHEREVEAVRQRQRQAVEEGDTQLYDRLEQQERDLLKNAPKDEAVQPPAPQEPPELTQYAASEAGKWINDPILRQFGSQAIAAAGLNGAPVQQQIEHAEKQVRSYFPHLFQQEEKPKPRQKVDGGGLGGGKVGKGVNSLPSEARDAGKEFVEMGVYKSLEDYAKDYWAQEK